MNKVSFSYEEKGEYAPKKDLDFVKRNNIAAIIKYKNELERNSALSLSDILIFLKYRILRIFPLYL